MNLKDFLVPLAVFALQMCVIKWIDVKIRFAKSEAEAIASIKEASVRLWSWVGLAVPGVFAVFEFMKEGPITKSAVFYLFLFSLGVAFKYSLYWTKKIISILQDYGKISLDVHSVLKGQNEILREHTQLLEELSEKKKKKAEPVARAQRGDWACDSGRGNSAPPGLFIRKDGLCRTPRG